jgi:LPXTG-site transpeptidase (sortase) family protein
VSADTIWTWTPDTPPAASRLVEPDPNAEPEPNESAGDPQVAPVPAEPERVKGKRRRDHKPVAAPTWEAVESASTLVHVPVLVPGKRRRPRTAPTLAPKVPLPVEDGSEVVGRRRSRKSRPAPTTPVPARSRRGRWIKAALVVGLVLVCAALPWAVPQIPDLFAKAVPEATSTPPVVDPTIDPETPSPQISVTPNPTLLGKRLEAAGKPVEVWVPRLHVRSQVVPISGRTGELVPPSNPQELGWWQEGREAGAPQGSVVVTGHTVSTGGGAFDHLGELVPGDHIRVRTSAGSIVYVVQTSRDVPVAKLARTAKQIFRQTGDGRLVLITCSDFNGQIYLSNSVVYATPEKDLPA